MTKIQKPKKKKATKASEEIADALGKAVDIKNLHDSEGGMLLIDGLVTDILDTLTVLTTNVTSLSHVQLVSMVSRIKERIDVVQVLTSAKSQVEVYQDLLKEALKEEKENELEETPT